MTRVDRAGAAAGAIGITVLLIGLFLPGPPPKTSDAVASLTHLLVHQRRLLLAGTYLAGLGGLTFTWFLGTLGQFLHEHTRRTSLVVTAVVGGLASIISMMTGIALVTGVALRAAGLAGAGPTVRAAIDGGNVFVELSKFGLAALVLATTAALWHTTILSAFVLRVGVVAGVLLVLSAISPFVADRGLWQFGGGPEVFGALPAAVWTIWLSVHLARSADEPSSPVAAVRPSELHPT